MKILFALASLLLFSKPDPSFLVVDKNFKKPVQAASDFTTAEYKQHCFPVYASETPAIIAATDKLVRLMDREPVCYQFDTVVAGHTTFLLIQDCGLAHHYSVMMITNVEEHQTSFGFALVRDEESKRKAQQKLLDFATYLAP